MTSKPLSASRLSRGASTPARWCVLLLVASWLWASVSGCSKTTASLPDEFMLGGIQVNEPDMTHWHDTLLATGFNTISLTVYARQGRWDSAQIDFDPDQLGGAVVREIRSAKRAGLHVVLILRVALEHALPENRFLWHGLIQPRTNAELDAWFFRYGEFVRSWAEVAETEGVDVFGIGSELSSLTSTRAIDRIPNLEAYYLDQEKQRRERARTLAAGAEVAPEAMKGEWGQTFDELPDYLTEQSKAQALWASQVTFDGDLEALAERRRRLDSNWRRLIDEVRSKYSGALTYAANFDQFDQVGFWDALDVMGINAYFPLRSGLSQDEKSLPQASTTNSPANSNDDSLLHTFERSWLDILDRIEDVRAELHPEAPVIFTELGYTRWQGSTIQPWAGDGFAVLGDPDAPVGEVVVWRQQPLAEEERALAIRSLGTAAAEHSDLLRGLLYWKLSTVPSHLDIEPFVLILENQSSDPMLQELTALPSRIDED